MIFTVYFSSSGSWCFEMCPTGRGVGTLLLDEIQKLQVAAIQGSSGHWKTLRKRRKRNLEPQMRHGWDKWYCPHVHIIYIYTHTHILFGHPPFCGTQVECRLKRRTCGMERVVFDGFRHFWNLQYRSIFHRWFPWGNQHGNEKNVARKPLNIPALKMLSFRDTLQDRDVFPCYLDSGWV